MLFGVNQNIVFLCSTMADNNTQAKKNAKLQKEAILEAVKGRIKGDQPRNFPLPFHISSKQTPQ